MPRPRKGELSPRAPSQPDSIVDDLQEALYRYIGKGTHGLDGYQPFSLERVLEVANANELGPQMREWMEVRQADNAILRMLLGTQLRKRRRHGHDIVVGPLTVPGEAYEYMPSNGPYEDPYRFRPRNGEHLRKAKPKRSLGEMLADLERYPDTTARQRNRWTPDDVKS